MGGCSSDGCESEDGGDQAAAPSASSAPAAPSAAATAALEPTGASVPETPKPTKTAASDVSSGPKAKRDGIADSPADGTTPFAKRFKTKTSLAPSVAGSTGAQLGDFGGRLKPP
eukprot:7828431-Pyramimonas_sp.AAC.1